MSTLRRFLLRLINVLRPERRESDLARELTSHLTLLEDDFQRRGLSPHEARVAARRAFGGIDQTKELHRDARSFVWLDDARRDLRHASRLLRRNPIFTLTAALSLAIGIGANTTIFTVATALLFKPPAGIGAPDRLVDIGSSRRGGEGFGTSSFPNYLDIGRRTTTLDGTFAYSLFPQAMSLGAHGANAGTERIYGTFVTANYFTVLGAVPSVGRLFTASDSEGPDASPIAVLSYRCWEGRFNRDPTIVGRSVTLNAYPFTIVGVASEGFHGTGVRAGDAWVPIGGAALSPGPGAATLTNRAASWLLIGGRLKPGVSVSQAAAEIDAIGRALEREYPDQNRGTRLRLLGSSPVPDMAAPVAMFLALLMTIVSLVLIIACANLSGILLARAAARRREIAVRLAIGAGRARLVRQLLAETIILFSLGGAVGLVMARGMTSLLVSLLPTLPFPVDVSLALDKRAIIFTTVLVLTAALLSGLAPALQASKTDVVSTLKDDVPALGRLRLRHAFVIAQVTLSILLVVIAGLFARALQRVGSMAPGFDPRGVELASLDLSVAGYTDVTGPLFARELIDRVRGLPVVQDATIAATLPGGFDRLSLGGLGVEGASLPNGTPQFSVDWNIVEPGYFSTLRIPLIAGRDFTAADRKGTQPVAIIGEGVARRFWPGKETQDAIGKHVLTLRGGPNTPPALTRTSLVVGVARDPKYGSLVDATTGLYVYVPLQQQYLRGMTMIVARTTRGQRIADELRALVASMNPNLMIATTQTADDYTALGLLPQRIAVSVSGSLGIVGALLAAIGIYGVTAYAVTRRTREIGIRLALGARRADVVGMILRQGMSLAVIGTALGLVLAAAAGRLLTTFLFGLPPVDPVTFAAAAVLFAAISLVACYVPVRRAVRIGAMEALRYE
jgi:predicted permease